MRIIYAVIFLFLMSGNAAAVCRNIPDVQEDMIERFRAADAVFLAKDPQWDAGDDLLVTVVGIWKGDLADRAQVVLNGSEFPRRDADFIIFSKTELNGYHSLGGRCFSNEVWREAKKLKLTEKELMTKLFGEPRTPKWAASIFFTYLGYFFTIAVLFGLTVLVANLVSPNKRSSAFRQ